MLQVHIQTEIFFLQFVSDWSDFLYLASSCNFMQKTGFDLQKASKLTELWLFDIVAYTETYRDTFKKWKNGKTNFVPMGAFELILWESNTHATKCSKWRSVFKFHSPRMSTIQMKTCASAPAYTHQKGGGTLFMSGTVYPCSSDMILISPNFQPLKFCHGFPTRDIFHTY